MRQGSARLWRRVAADQPEARFVVPLILLVGLLSALRAHAFLLDDGAIDTRYIRNLAAGDGWRWNAGGVGGHVNGVTSAAFVLAAALLTEVVGSASLAQHLLGGVLAGVAGVAAWRMLRLASAGPAAAVVGLALPVLPSLTHTWGLETSGYLAALLVGPQLRGRPAWILAGLGPLVRPDGILLSVLLIGRELATDRRIRWRRAAIGAAVLAPWLLYSAVTFHELVPSTVGAKALQGQSATGGFTYTAGWRSELIRWTGSGTGAVAVLAAAVAGLLLAVARRHQAFLGFAGVVVVQQLIFALVPVPSYRWYYVPLLALLLVSGGLFAGWLLTALRTPQPLRLAVSAAAAIALLLSWFPQDPRVNDPRERSYAEISALLAPAAPGSVVCSEIGILGADLPLSRPVIDLSGLTTSPVLTEARHREVFWTRPSRYFVFHWFTDRGVDRLATRVVDQLDPALGPGTTFGSEAPFVLDARFTHYRLMAVVHHAPYAALVVMMDPAVTS